MKHFDAIIIGTGQAGPSRAARVAGVGKRVAIVERHRFGYFEYMSAQQLVRRESDASVPPREKQ
jgi:flavin-dependent dehydrogenase